MPGWNAATNTPLDIFIHGARPSFPHLWNFSISREERSAQPPPGAFGEGIWGKNGEREKRRSELRARERERAGNPQDEGEGNGRWGGEIEEKERYSVGMGEGRAKMGRQREMLGAPERRTKEIRD